jgi:predicted naringenin-chalcone synthase
MALLIDVSTASPPYVLSQTAAAAGLKQRMGGGAVIGRMIDAAASRSGITTRRVVVPDAEPDVQEPFYALSPEGPHPDTARRMDLYRQWSARLAVEACSTLLEKTGTAPASVDRLITVSCTGFSAPNFDHHIITRLGLPATVTRTHIGFMGCAAAVVGMTSALEASRDPAHRNILLVAVELCSLHLQPEPTRDNILANMIFADGCAAALFSSDPDRGGKLRLLRTHSLLFENSNEMMGWEIGNHGFQMMLSPLLPDIIAQQAAPAAKKILSEHQIPPEKISHWALHPGGRAILDALQTGLGLSEEQTAPSRSVLNRFGNMSSASILFVMKALRERSRIQPGELLCAIAFGPGLTMELALFEGV